MNLDISEAEVDASIAMLDEAYETSPYPSTPAEAPYREFLLKVREQEWEDLKAWRHK